MKRKFNFLSAALFVALLLTGFSSFSQVYARLERAPDTWHLNDDWDYHEVYDLYVRFYSDAACTTPLTLTSDVTVTVQNDYYLTESYSPNTYHSGGSYPAYAYTGDHEIYLNDCYFLLIDYDNGGSYWTRYAATYTLLPGSGYTVVSPNF